MSTEWTHHLDLISTSHSEQVGLQEKDNPSDWTAELDMLYHPSRLHDNCCLYLKDEEAKKSWEFYLPNTLEQFGLYGKVMNFACHLCFDYCRRHDSFQSLWIKRKMDHLTNMDSLRDRKKTSRIEVDSTQFLGEEDKENLLKGMRTKLLILKNFVVLVYLLLDSYQLISCLLFIYNENSSILTEILAVTDVFLLFFAFFVEFHYCWLHTLPMYWL